MAELAVISGRASSVRRLRELMQKLGPQASAWLPQFMSEATQAAPNPQQGNKTV